MTNSIQCLLKKTIQIFQIKDHAPTRLWKTSTSVQREYINCLQNQHPHKATGPDEIPAFIIRAAASQLAPLLARIYQRTLDHGEIPQDWRDALVVPIFQNGERHIAANYRPVSLTSISCTILEHIIHSNIMKHFDTNKILTDTQHGFRKKRSIESHLLVTVQEIVKRLATGSQVDIILLDFAKAFDKVPHSRLLYKLEYYGIDQVTIKWIKSFQNVVLVGVKWSSAQVLSGVPQGSVLGPLLFLAYINGMPETINHSETRLFRKINNTIDSDLLLQDLRQIGKWVANEF